jgi:hypothetical protein
MSGTDADYTLLHHRALFNIKQEKMEEVDTVNTAHGPDVVMLSSSPAAAATTAATASLSEEAVLVEAALESEEDSPQPNLDQRIEDEAVRYRYLNLSRSSRPHLFCNLDPGCIEEKGFVRKFPISWCFPILFSLFSRYEMCDVSFC